MRKFNLVVVAATLTLAACGKKEDEPVTNNLVEPPFENVVEEEPAPTPEPSNNATAPEPAPPPSISEQQQIEDDAAATGMTARISPDESANATQ